MNFVPSFISTRIAVILSIGALGAAYLYYEYRCKRAEEQILEYELAKLQSPDVYAQRHAIENLLEHVSKDKSLLSLFYDNPDKSLQLLKSLIVSRDPDVQSSAIEIVSLMSENDKRLDIIREVGLFQALLSVLSSPYILGDDVVESILITIKNCTKPTIRILQNPETGQLTKVEAEKVPRDRNDDVYDRDDEWFTKELYQHHGLESIVTKLLSEDEDIQELALEIITNYCKLWKNKEEVGELGGLAYIATIFSSASTFELQSLALSALWHCVNRCESNVAQLRKVKPISSFISFLQTNGTGAGGASQTDLCIVLSLLMQVVDGEGAALIRKEGLLPQLIEYPSMLIFALIRTHQN